VRKLPSGRYQARYLGQDGLMRSAPATFATQTVAQKWLTLIEAEIVLRPARDPHYFPVGVKHRYVR